MWSKFREMDDEKMKQKSENDGWFFSDYFHNRQCHRKWSLFLVFHSFLYLENEDIWRLIFFFWLMTSPIYIPCEPGIYTAKFLISLLFRVNSKTTLVGKRVEKNARLPFPFFFSSTPIFSWGFIVQEKLTFITTRWRWRWFEMNPRFDSDHIYR